jgi:photosystem II stability/assembly factor-like uncharacterized protein
MCVVAYAQEEGTWQGQKPPQQTAKDAASQVEVSEFMVRDTGGSGGMFGQGDIRRNLLDVAFWTDGMHGAACGTAGAFYTEDGGLTWKRIRQRPRKEYGDKEGLGVQYYCVELAGPREIWVAEGKHPRIGRHLWHSTDAGQSWEDVSQRFPGPFKSVSDLVVRGQDIWLLAGDHWTYSYRSDDGGKTWQKLGVLPGTLNSHQYAAIPASAPHDRLETISVLGDVRRQDGSREIVLARTDDGGKNWRRIDLPKDLPPAQYGVANYRIAFATPEVGMIGLPAAGLRFPKHGVFEKDPGATASVLVTADGGATWTRRDLPNEELEITALWMDPANSEHALAGVWNKFLVQNGGPRNGPALYETFDGGQSWGVAVRGNPQINAIFGLDSRQVWAVGNAEGFVANDVVAILSEPGGEK